MALLTQVDEVVLMCLICQAMLLQALSLADSTSYRVEGIVSMNPDCSSLTPKVLCSLIYAAIFNALRHAADILIIVICSQSLSASLSAHDDSHSSLCGRIGQVQ